MSPFFPVYPGNSIENNTFKIYSILEISGKFNVHGSLCFQCLYAHVHNQIEKIKGRLSS